MFFSLGSTPNTQAAVKVKRIAPMLLLPATIPENVLFGVLYWLFPRCGQRYVRLPLSQKKMHFVLMAFIDLAHTQVSITFIS